MCRSLTVPVVLAAAGLLIPLAAATQTPVDRATLFQAAYQGLLEELPDGPHGVVDDTPPVVATPDALDRERRTAEHRRFAAGLGLPVGPLDELMPCPERDPLSGCPLVDDLAALVTFTVHSVGDDSAIVLAEVWRTGGTAGDHVAILGGYKGYRVTLDRDGEEWMVGEVSVFIDS